MKLQLAVTLRQAAEATMATILKSDDVTEDVGHLCNAEKTAASAIFKNVEDDDGDEKF